MTKYPDREWRFSQEDWLKASRLTAGGVTFLLTLSASQFLQGRLLGISAASRAATFAGMLSVSTGSMLASLAADEAPATLSVALGWVPEKDRRRKGSVIDKRGTISSSTFSLLGYDAGKKEERLLGAARTALVGMLLFKGLGGRFSGVAPSNVAQPGAFFNVRGTLPAGLEYASPKQKRRLDMFGWVYGCHTCGRRQMGDYVGDHMPPRKVAVEMSRRWWRRLLGIRVKQRFTPQCRPCSSIQSAAVRSDRRILVYHYLSLRRYHATGAVLEVVSLMPGQGMLDGLIHQNVEQVSAWWRRKGRAEGDWQRR